MERRDTSTNELQEWYCSTQNCCQVTHFFLVLAFHQFAASHVEFAKSIHKNEEKNEKIKRFFSSNTSPNSNSITHEAAVLI